MTYALAATLQTAVYERLSNDAAVAAEVATAIFDAPPAGQVPDVYVVIGQEDVRDRSDATHRMAEHRFIVSVHGTLTGYLALKRAAAAVDKALTSGGLSLAAGKLVSLRFLRARARRGSSANSRRVDMTFRAVLDDLQN